MGLPRISWAKLNHQQTGVGLVLSAMCKLDLAPKSNCKCGAIEQTADHVISAGPIHRAPLGVAGLTVLNDDT